MTLSAEPTSGRLCRSQPATGNGQPATSNHLNTTTMSPEQRSYRDLHIAVFLFGFTAILGDLIQLTALMIVWWRVFLTSISLLFLVRVGKLFATLARKTLLQFMGIGIIVGIHWLTFYGSIKLANASVCLVCMATTSFFTSLTEPLFTHRRIKWYELALGLLIIPGMVLVVNSVEADWSMVAGIGLGLLSAFLAALFATFNKILIARTDELSITFLELGSAWVFLSLVLPVYILVEDAPLQLWPTPRDWIYLLVLVLLCTTLAYVLALRALRHLTAFASNLTINLEPVYGIILAWLILKDHDEVGPNFYWGAMIILCAVFCYPLVRRYERKKLIKK